MKAVVTIMAMGLAWGGCSAPEDMSSIEQKKKPRAGCRMDRGDACLGGAIVSAPRIRLEGVDYFDADDLGRHVTNHVTITPDESMTDVKLQLVTPLSNANFMDGFRVYVKGERALSTSVNRSGAFSQDHMIEGSYDVMAQRKTPAQLVGLDEDGVEVVKSVCLVIYAEKQDLFIAKGEQAYLVLDEFQLELLDQTCEKSSRRRGVGF